MKRRGIYLLAFLCLALFLGAAFSGLTLAQTTPATATDTAPSFEVASEIGRAMPQKLLYDPNFERYAVIDAYGQLSLVNALTFETEHILYDQAIYNDMAFSHNGRWLALAINTRIELWDTESGQRIAHLDDLSQSLSIHGPMTFSQDDNLLLFYGTYPAPQSLRRYENDTIDVPWLWSLTAARNEGDSTFPHKVEAQPFFDYRNGFVLGPDNRIVAALPRRLHVIDAYTTQVLYDIDTARYEQDPMDVLFSARDNRIYVQPVDQNSLIQVDTQRGVLVQIPLDTGLTHNDLQTLGGIELGSQAGTIGPAASLDSNPLLMVLLGDHYHDNPYWAGHPVTTTLVDLLTPPTSDQSDLYAMLFVYDEQEDLGYFVVSAPYDVQQMLLSHEGNDIALRRSTDEEYIEMYNLHTGQLERSFIPSLRGVGYYSPTEKNRVLAYDTSGAVIISDFERFDAATGDVKTEDLRYSRRFDHFFFAGSNDQLVTLSGSEWRLWNAATGQVVDRKVLRLNGDIIATSDDGYRYLTQFQDVDGTSGVETFDVNTGERRTLRFTTLRGRSIDQLLPSPDWNHFLIVYSANQWGPYYPGNEVTVYSMLEGGQDWFFAGDDLPYVRNRSYGWVDNNTAYVYGQGNPGDQPGRIYAGPSAPLPWTIGDGPGCLAWLYYPGISPEAIYQAWPRITVGLSADEQTALAQFACTRAQEIANTPPISDSGTLPPPTPTPPVVLGNVPVCLLQRYAGQADSLVQDWQSLVASMNSTDAVKLATFLCDGLSNAPRLSNPRGVQTMMIDAVTGVRSYGDYTPPEDSRPIQPVLDEFYSTEKRQMGTAILSADEQLVAASSLPGELVIYRFLTPYRTILGYSTATAGANFQQQNLIGALASPTPTFAVLGTARPTLTPTITPTPPPRPDVMVDQPLGGQAKDFCPAESLYTMDALPDGYSPTGRLIGAVQGSTEWAIEPETGQRYSDPNIPLCDFGVLRCKISPNGKWILAFDVNSIYVVHPDGTDTRVLFTAKTTEDTYNWPSDIWWSGGDTVEYQQYGQVKDHQNHDFYGSVFYRDEIGVFPDPNPWSPRFQDFMADGQPLELIERQPGGPLAVARTTFSTGVNPGYAYYIVNTDTGEASYFARLTEYPEQDLQVFWHPLGTQMFYAYPTPPYQPVVWYVYDVASNTHRRMGDFYGGTVSPGGRYVAFSRDSRTQPIGVWDMQTGLVTTYCLPQTGARHYDGAFTWSPDERYIALQAGLPADETQEGVGQHTLILDIATGSVTDLTHGVGNLMMWADEPSPQEGQPSS